MVAKKAPEKSNVSKDDLLKYYREMLLIRRFEEKAGQLYGMGLIGGSLGLDLIAQGAQVRALVHRPATAERARQRQLATDVSTDPGVLEGCGLVVLALPLDRLLDLSQELVAALPPEAYLWFKTLHIVGVVVWFAGLFYLVRLFIYHREAEELEESLRPAFQAQYGLMERRLANIITTPGMVVAVVCAAGLLSVNPAWLQQGWMHAKLAFVAALLATCLRALQATRGLQDGMATAALLVACLLVSLLPCPLRPPN